MTVNVEIADDGKHINIDAALRYKELCASIPGSRYVGGRWRLPVSWASCLALRTTFRDELVIGPKLTDWAIHERSSRVDPSMMLREIIAMDETQGDPDLYPHQRAGVKFLATAKRALLADEPGLGKSAQAIRALLEIQRRGIMAFPALVVCPNTLKTNWKREFEKWWPGVKVQIIHGTAAQRRKQFEEYFKVEGTDDRYHVLIVNWESLKGHSRLAPYGSVALKKCQEHGGEDPKITPARCEVHERELNRIDFQAVIADEIHRAKSPKAATTRALWSATGNAEYRFALTGTPQSSDVTDLWSIMHWLAPEEWPSKSKWIDRTVDTMLNAFGGMHVIGIKPTMQEEFHALLNPRMRRMLKSVVLPWLPEIVYQVRDVEMSAKQAKAYKQMKEKSIAALDNGEYVLAADALLQAKRLQQFANSYAEIVVVPGDPLHPDPEKQMDKEIVKLSEPSATLDAVVDDITNGDFGDDQVAISAVSSQLLELLSAKLTKAGIPHGMITGDYAVDVRQNAIDDFQQGRTKVILFTVQAGGVGVTLTAARWLLRIERPWSLIDDVQGRDRVHRIGSEIHDSIMIVDYIVKDTVQSKVHEALERKGEQFEEVVKDREQIRKMIEGAK
ncbi:DNA helicase [Microbacterium phage Pumpernickel]|uniref:DNA helicase n=1 Tax=Microbacterium phage Pumpernickel TaxID=2885983 RepID=A0AAE9C2U9_9CAUD|nr:DNA helicase [Microbacterium phage Pumpernickel]UDL15902.1 DNA helicase [Microbacterium phage Pumpernickel]